MKYRGGRISVFDLWFYSLPTKAKKWTKQLGHFRHVERVTMDPIPIRLAQIAYFLQTAVKWSMRFMAILKVSKFRVIHVRLILTWACFRMIQTTDCDKKSYFLFGKLVRYPFRWKIYLNHPEICSIKNRYYLNHLRIRAFHVYAWPIYQRLEKIRDPNYPIRRRTQCIVG